MIFESERVDGLHHNQSSQSLLVRCRTKFVPVVHSRQYYIIADVKHAISLVNSRGGGEMQLGKFNYLRVWDLNL